MESGPSTYWYEQWIINNWRSSDGSDCGNVCEKALAQVPSFRTEFMSVSIERMEVLACNEELGALTLIVSKGSYWHLLRRTTTRTCI